MRRPRRDSRVNKRAFRLFLVAVTVISVAVSCSWTAHVPSKIRSGGGGLERRTYVLPHGYETRRADEYQDNVNRDRTSDEI